jgi:hypothetical protein
MHGHYGGQSVDNVLLTTMARTTGLAPVVSPAVSLTASIGYEGAGNAEISGTVG